jgi:hypothetical protein
LDQARVVACERFVVEPEGFGLAGRKAFDDDVGPSGKGEEGRSIFRGLEVEDGAALAAIPDVVARLVAEGIVTGRLDAGHLGAVVDEEHRRHRTRDASAQIENTDAVEYA